MNQSNLFGGEVEKGNMFGDKSSWGEDFHY